MLASTGAAPRTPRHPRRPPLRRVLAIALAVPLLAVAAARLGVTPDAAGAAVVPATGYDGATVDGWHSHYGAYDLGDLGVGWCIDHGMRGPDPDLVYRPTTLATLTPDVRTALAWMVGRHGLEADRVTGAAIMLAGHDLAGAVYPSGRLDVERLGADRLSGFGADGGAVLERARALRADALARSHLRGPLRLDAAVEATDDPGGPVMVVARVLDADDRPVPDIAVRVVTDGAPVVGGAPGATTATVSTGLDGSARFTVAGALAARRVALAAVVPDLALRAFAPTTGRAQRVIVPGTVELAAVVEVPAPPGTLVVRKRGDAEAVLPVVGARFEVHRRHDDATSTPVLVAENELVVGADGTTPPVELVPGRYLVVEVEAPPGYAAAGPWEVMLDAGAAVEVVADNVARRGELRLTKVDGDTGDVLAGARLTVHHDADGDGDAETEVATVETTTEATVLTGLLPGRYVITEIAAPPGYDLRAEPLEVEVGAGATVELVAPNTRTPPPTTAPPPAPPTTAPLTTAPPTTVGATATTEPPPRSPEPTVRTAAPAPAGPATLPRTGSDPVATTCLAVGLSLLGVAARRAGGRRTTTSIG